MFFQPVYSGDRLDEEAFRVVTYVYGEMGSLGIVRGAPTTLQVPRLEGQLGDVRVMQRMADLFENEARGGFEVQGAYTSDDISG